MSCIYFRDEIVLNPHKNGITSIKLLLKLFSSNHHQLITGSGHFVSKTYRKRILVPTRFHSVPGTPETSQAHRA